MDLVVQRLPELTGADGAVVELAEGDEMVYAAASGSAAQHIGLRLKAVGSFSGLCVRTDQVMSSEDTETDPRVDLAATRAVGVRSMVVAPLKYEGKVVGAVKLLSPRLKAFDERQIASLELMAGVLGGALGHAHAYAERTTAELQARASTQHLEAVLRAATEVAIIGIDLHHRVVVFNEGARRMLGYTAEEVVGSPPTRFFDADELDARAAERGTTRAQVFIGAARHGGAATDEWTFVRKDGTRLQVSLTVTAMHGAGGELEGFIGIAADITERKAADKLKDQFVSTVAHELRTPLTSIRGSLGLLHSGLLSAHPERGQRMLSIAVDNTDRLLRLVNDMLDLERMRLGRVQIQRTELDLAAVMHEAVEVMHAMADAAGVRLQVQPLSARVCADRDRLVQVLTNLLSNALKFSHSGGDVCLRGHALEDAMVRIEVQDHGRGIPTDKLERVFDRFQQVETGDARRHSGTGLGLAICREIIQQHGGRIWAESVLGEGTTIIAEMPILVS